MKTKVQIITDKSVEVSVPVNTEMLDTVDNTTAALESVIKNKLSIIFVDSDVEKENTGIFIKAISSESPDTKIILLGNKLDDEFIVSCLFLGAFGYLDWADKEHFFNKVIDVVAKGEAWFSRRIVGLALKSIHG